jgi:hypothetical protein
VTQNGPDKVFSETSLCGSRPDSSALGPDVFEDESRDDETEENSNHTIADVIEIGIGRVSLKHAVEEGERDL